MKAILFNGALERRATSTAGILSDYVAHKLQVCGLETQIFNIADSGIPLFDFTISSTPKGVEMMNNLFRDADVHIWMAPLYHGSIPGVMKNCLDWLEISAKSERPYLTDKTVGLVCWADGAQAMQGINAMDAISKALRAWTMPFSVPILKGNLFDEDEPKVISENYQKKLDLLVHLATTRVIATV